MKRVLLVVPFNYGTIGLCSLNLYKAFLKREDVQVKCVVVHKSRNGYSEYEDCDGCSIGEVPLIKKLFAGFAQIKWLSGIKREFNPDITISTLFGCSTISVLSGGSDKKIGIFHSPHQQVRCKGLLYYWYTLLQYTFVYSRLDKLFCVSEEVRDSIVNSFKSIDANKVKVVYNIHDIEHIKKKSEEPIEAEYANLLDNPTILYCGRLDNNKAPIRLIDAFAKAEKPLNAQLVIMGKDYENLWPNLSKVVKDYGLSENVHYIGPKSNPYKYMKKAVALCSCSYSEGLPGVIIESLLLGRPVVTTNSSRGIWEIFSVSDEYNKNLSDIFHTSCGCITSNLSHGNSSMYETDICNLANALNFVLHNDFSNIEFKFEEQVGDHCLDIYLENL